MFWKRKKRKPFTVKVCWADGKEEQFNNVIYWEFHTNSILMIKFEKQLEREDVFFPISQIRWFSGKD